jgi:hypothetical protein
MQIVIDIDEKRYKDILRISTVQLKGRTPTLEQVIANGTPLPKGHGDLKDADKLKDAFIKWSMAVQGFFTDSDIASIVYNSPTIIEEDKTESEE